MLGGRFGLLPCGSDSIQKRHLCNQLQDQPAICQSQDLYIKWESDVGICNRFQDLGWSLVGLYFVLYLGVKIFITKKRIT